MPLIRSSSTVRNGFRSAAQDTLLPPGSRRRRWLVLLVVVPGMLITACERPADESANDTAVTEEAADEVETTAAGISYRGWRPTEAGRVLLVPTASALEARLIYPEHTDSTLTASTTFELEPVRGLRVDLFSPAGAVGTAELGPVEPPPASCIGWPRAPVIAMIEPMSPWTVAFTSGLAEAVPLDSIAALTSADSARLAAEAARVASRLPNDTVAGFRGLPFVVRNARRFTPAPDVQAFVADVVRRVGQEANPMMEHIIVIAERNTAQAPARYEPVYHERVTGLEETMEMSAVLALVTLGADRRPTLVVGRDYVDGNAYSLIERPGDGEWRLRWSSAYAGC